MRSAIGLGIIMTLVLVACAQAPRASANKPVLSGEKAMEYVRAQVAFGPRPPGSPALEKCRAYIRRQLEGFGYQIDDDSFLAQTPYGPITMHNLVAHKGKGEKGIIALASHYDTKLMENMNFVGANDAGSSTGLLLELARVLAESKDGLDCWFVFLDGEEAFVEWSTFDSTYGSRHLAQRWKREGVASKIRALILLDMIGDKDLDIWYETNSTKRLMDLVWTAAQRIGLGSILSQIKAPVGDDHLPFIDVGIPSVDIIDLNYGPNNSYHHTAADSLDKVSPESMEKVGRIVLEMLPELQKQGFHASRSRLPTAY
jgi:glutaminyl-peptide cyclotransferase